MSKKYKKIDETSDIYLNTKMIKSNTQIIKEKIEDIEGILCKADTKIVIYNGKKYRVVETNLSQTRGEASVLNLSCVEALD